MLRATIRLVATEVRHGHLERAADLRYLHHALYTLDTGGGEAGAPRPRATTVRCAHEGCTGDLDDGECSVCGRRTCLRCGGVEDEHHVCDPDAVLTHQAIARDCRPCAGCGAPSFRTEGCPTMWCARCHTFWHWDTGRAIETRGAAVPHNPDHREWLRGGGSARRELDDVPCGGLPDGAQLHGALMREFLRHMGVPPYAAVITDAAEGLAAAQRLRHEFPRVWNEAEDNEALRVSHLVGDLDEDAFAAALERRERLRRYKSDVGHVLEGLVYAGADVMQRFVAHDDLYTAAMCLVQLRALADEALRELSVTHSRTVPRLPADDWRWRLPHGRQRV